MFWTLFCTLLLENRLFLVSFAPFGLFFVQLFVHLIFCVFIRVFSWLTHWIVAPALVGSSPTSRPFLTLVSPLFTGVFVFSGFLFGHRARFVHPCRLPLSGRKAKKIEHRRNVALTKHVGFMILMILYEPCIFLSILYTIYGNCGGMSSDCRLSQLDASGWLFTYKKKRTKPRRAPSVYTFVFLLMIAL